MKNKAVFLDRDGVINIEKKDYVKSIDEFEIFENVVQSIKLLKENNFLIIIVTNQSAINRKLLSLETLNTIHENFITFLTKNNTSIDRIYFCPHMPEENCTCRKPKPGMLLRAIEDFDIDVNSSFMIGDSLKDIEAAKAVGCKGILLKEGNSLFNIVKKLVNHVEI